MALTRCGLLVDRAETIAKLYASYRDWTVVEEEWLEGRYDERSTRGSSQGIYRILSSRFKTAGSDLPPIGRLPSVFDQCETTRDKAQVLYFYLLEDDPLVKYIVHRYVQRLEQSGTTGLDFGHDTVAQLLSEFHYKDGSTFEYADSTTQRWGEGFRSIMREIGVLETQQSTQGGVPNIGTIPLLVAAGYSWEQDGADWLTQPLGLLYLFQSEQYWNSLATRIAEHSDWEASELHGNVRLQPVNGTYGWAEPMEEADD